jgi:hypothetical protein
MPSVVVVPSRSQSSASVRHSLDCVRRGPNPAISAKFQLMLLQKTSAGDPDIQRGSWWLNPPKSQRKCSKLDGEKKHELVH